jgi:hypothetical protein
VVMVAAASRWGSQCLVSWCSMNLGETLGKVCAMRKGPSAVSHRLTAKARFPIVRCWNCRCLHRHRPRGGNRRRPRQLVASSWVTHGVGGVHRERGDGSAACDVRQW